MTRAEMIAKRRSLLVGKMFGRLTVQDGPFLKPPNERRRFYQCLCSCGNAALIADVSLLDGSTRSCGCLSAESRRDKSLRHRIHGGKDNLEYFPYVAMTSRCENPRDKSYARYGGRGIRVFPEWRASFVRFMADMGPRPSRKHTLNRIDNDGNYEPGNVEWASADRQSRNRSNTRILRSAGLEMCLKDWGERLGVTPQTIRRRLKLGWTIDDAVSVSSYKGVRA